MPKRKTELQIKNILKYYDDKVASGSSKPQLDTATKYKITRQTVSNYLKKRDNTEEHHNETETFAEIVAEKQLDEQFNEEHGGRIENARTENIVKFMEEKFPKRAKKLLDKNYERAIEETFQELEIGVPSKDIEDLREGVSLTDILNDNRRPLTLTEQVEQKKAQADIIEADKRIELAKSVLLEEEGNQFVIEKGVKAIKGMFEEQPIIEEFENLYYDDNYEEMYNDFISVYSYVKDPNSNKSNSAQLFGRFVLKWSFKQAQAEEIKGKRAEVKQKVLKENENRLAVKRHRELEKYSDEELSELFNKSIGDKIDALTN